jgi:hypothetical protein
MNVHGREYLYFSRYPQKTRKATLAWAIFFYRCQLVHYQKERKKGEKEIELHRIQQDHSLQFSASGPVQRQPLPRPKPQFVTTCPPTTNTLLV